MTSGNRAALFGVSLLVCLALVLLLAATGFLLGQPVQSWYVPLGVLLAALLCWRGARLYQFRYPGLTAGMVMLIQLALLGAGAMVIGGVYDLSWDGQWYHQEGIIRLVQGWNPLSDFTTSQGYSTDMLVKNYAKGPWIAAAGLTRLTGDIEQAKIFNVALILAAFAVTYAALTTLGGLAPVVRVIIALLAALNPVSVYQCLSFNLDGQVASLILCLLCLLYLVGTRLDHVLVVGLIAAVILLVNAKFTAVVYALVLIGSALVWLLARRHTHEAARLAGSCGMAVVLSLYVGINPYLTNTIAYGNPFYPALGSGIDVLALQRPADFMAMSAPERLVVSLLARTDNPKAPRGAELKWPFTLVEDPAVYEAYDTRLGGFGPLFSGALVLTLPLLVLAVWRPQRFLPALLLMGVLVGSALTNPEAWWARLAPQLWLMPVVAIIVYLRERGLLRALGALLVIVLAANIGLIAIRYVPASVERSRQLHARLAELAHVGEVVAVRFRTARSSGVRLDNSGVPYIETGELLCAEPEPIALSPQYGASICTGNDTIAEVPTLFVIPDTFSTLLDNSWYDVEDNSFRWMASPADLWIYADRTVEAQISFTPYLISDGSHAVSKGVLRVGGNQQTPVDIAMLSGRSTGVTVSLQRGINIVMLEVPAGNFQPGSGNTRVLGAAFTRIEVQTLAPR